MDEHRGQPNERAPGAEDRATGSKSAAAGAGKGAGGDKKRTAAGAKNDAAAGVKKQTAGRGKKRPPAGAKKRATARPKKWSRPNERFAFDLEHGGRCLVAGADEAGRGSLAGPIVAAAVCFDYAALSDPDFKALDRLTDSKQLQREEREALYGLILERACHVAVVACSAAGIDERGLHRCNIAALGAALEHLERRPQTAFTDGFRVPGCAVGHDALIGGDTRSAVVAAASIVAKVTRDRVMVRLHEQFPMYGFDHHVGYATPEHQEMITLHGVCHLHRRSFDAVSYRQLGLVFDA
jgi:ribonuclease HII